MDLVPGNHSTSLRWSLDCVWNVMAHAQKPDFVFRRNGRVHLNRRGRQFGRLLAAEVCASAVVMVVMLDIPCSEVVWRVLATQSICQFPLHFPSRASTCAITFQLDSNYWYWLWSLHETLTVVYGAESRPSLVCEQYRSTAVKNMLGWTADDPCMSDYFVLFYWVRVVHKSHFVFLIKETPIKWQVGAKVILRFLQDLYVHSRPSSLVSRDSTHTVQVNSILFSDGQYRVLISR